MNFEGIGKSYFKIINTDNDKLSKDIYVEDDKKKVSEYLTEIKLTKSNEIMQQIPVIGMERSILYITGASGSGKSYYTANFGEQYRKKYKNRPIYLFSSLQEDSIMDKKIKNLKRIKLSDEFLTEQFSINDFKDSLVIFDDTDAMTDKWMKNKINSIRDLILETGRHTNTSLIYTSHLPSNGLETRRILNECMSITIYPRSLGGRSLKYLLDNYLGLDKNQIKQLKKLNSRWITIIKSYPMIILYDKGSYTINLTDD